MAPQQAASWPSVLRGPELKQKVADARVLCVGAGGIGCELLKTLVCTGFKSIEVIDLDTIETSNLNRQFLFRRKHVGQSKAVTAAEVIQALRPQAAIKAHHANVKDKDFDVDYFRSFDIVLNGLDNLEARRHVNRLCLAAGTPLVESGTAGYLGQVTVHLKGATECFECTPKPTPKTFAICTLRNTPDRPIHCIEWSKSMLFPRLFGKPDAVSDLDEQQKADGEQGEEGEQGQATQEDLSFFLRRDDEPPLEYAQRMFTRLFATDIENVCSMDTLWKTRAKPKPLLLQQLLPDLSAALQRVDPAASTACKALGLANPNDKWSVEDNARVFLTAVAIFLEQRPQEVGSALFDKDDDLAVEVVAAASNLRCANYSIPLQSLFDAKGMAGNIIHAIATTNAIISGLIVTEALKVLAGLPPTAQRSTFLYEAISNKRLLAANKCDPPAPGCVVCGKAKLHLRINTATTLLSTLLDKVMRKRLAVNSPSLTTVVERDEMCFSYEEGEDLDEDEAALNASFKPKTLAALPGGGIVHGKWLHVVDQDQNFEVDILISHQETFDDEKEPDGFVLEGAVPAAKPEEPTADSAATAAAPGDGAVEEAAPSAAPAAGRKRKEMEGGGAELGPSAKAAKTGAEAGSSKAAALTLGDDDDVVELD